MENKTMAATMAPTMIPENAHKDIPGNPSTAKTSTVKLMYLTVNTIGIGKFLPNANLFTFLNN